MKKNNSSQKFYYSIKSVIEEAKSKIVRNINNIIVNTYLEIGKRIVEEE